MQQQEYAGRAHIISAQSNALRALFAPASRRMRGLRWRLDFERRLGVECRVIHAVPA